MTDDKKKLRSADWFGREDKGGFIHRSWMKRGLPDHEFDGRPVIGICNTWSELTPCNIHFRDLAEAVKRGQGNGSVKGGESGQEAEELREDMQDDSELIETQGKVADPDSDEDHSSQPDPDAALEDEERPKDRKDRDSQD